MVVRFNPRDNGACPFCRRLGGCTVRRTMEESLKDRKDAKKLGMEVVIYACPFFEEKP
jgi:hypothetical protein